MGLRLWKDPEDDAIVEDAAAKLDRAAAIRRSTIRREPSIRPGRDHAPSQSIALFLRNRHQNMLRTRDRLRQEERETSTQIAHLQSELERLRQVRLRNRVRLSEELEAFRAGRDSPESNSPIDQLNPDENNESNSENPPDTTRHSLPRPPRESNLRFEVLPATGASRSSSPWRYQVLSRTTMPSPPRSAGEDRRLPAIPDGPIPDGPIPGEPWNTDSPHMPALTEGFAPARAGDSGTTRPSDRHGVDDDFQGLETPPPETWESSYPPLQRVGHNSPRPAPRVDGLGDRRRSPSPLPHQDEEDSWISTLLTTMDTSRSSSASSFSSSHGDTIRRSHNSSQTTSTSFGEIGSLDDTCELDLPEGITEDHVRSIREQHSSTRRSRPDADARMLMALQYLQSHGGHREDSEVGMFHAILERMQRRESIPPEWWVTVGLPPDFGRTT